MKGLKENLFMKAGTKKIPQMNIKGSPGQWQKKKDYIPNNIITCRVWILKKYSYEKLSSEEKLYDFQLV